MFANLTKGLLAAIAVKQIDNCRRLSIQLLMIDAVTGYLHGVQVARLSVIGLMRMMLLIGFIGVGVLLLHAGLFILLPWSVGTKAVLGISLGLTYVAIGSVVLHVSVNEKMWMKKSGVAEMLEKVTDQ